MALILGIDPGSQRVGWGLIRQHGNELEHRSSGVIEGGKGQLCNRLAQIGEQCDILLAKFTPDVVAIETMFHHRGHGNIKSALTLSHARGALLMCIARAKIPIFEYSPAEIKQVNTGNGRAPKEAVEKMVWLTLGGDAAQGKYSLDRSDALAAAICHARTAPLHKLYQGLHNPKKSSFSLPTNPIKRSPLNV